MKTIEVKDYIDKEGNPSCANNFNTGEVCEFYLTSNFGTKEHCFFAKDGSLLERRALGLGSLIPSRYCKIWDMK